MKKWIVLVLLVASMMPLAASQVVAADETARSRGLDGQSSQTGIVDVGNKYCPVMGGPIGGKDFVVYQGKRYGLCCPGCGKTFLSDPAKYLAQMEAKEKASAPAAVTPDQIKSEAMEKGMEQGSL